MGQSRALVILHFGGQRIMGAKVAELSFLHCGGQRIMEPKSWDHHFCISEASVLWGQSREIVMMAGLAGWAGWAGWAG